MPGPTTSTADLAARLIAGDRSAVEGLLGIHLPAVRAYVRLRAGPKIRAKESESDLVQSVCREVLQKIDNFAYDGEAGFKAWLFTTALRKIADRADYWQAERRDPAREVNPRAAASDANDSSPGMDLADLYRTTCTPSRELMRQEFFATIEAAFDGLSEDHREAILLSRIAGLSRTEVAARMGKTEDSVRNLLFRGLTELSKTLDRGE